MTEALGMRGEFRLLHKIGEGGMADVFLAERLGDDGFRTRVALKRLHRGLASDSYFIRQLVREARLLGQLEHANIVKVFDLRRIGDEYYVVMEYVDGIDLAAVIKVHRNRRTRIPRPFFFHVALSIAEALAYAHAAVDAEGNATPLIHRDIKPSNVMLSRRGIVKLTDFGIAHVGDGSVTGGLVQGTANYMSPEQAFGEERLAAASDVYSLGAVFYEMLTARPLIDGDNYLKAIHQVRERRVTLDELATQGVEPGLRMVIAKMLSHDISGRYQDMESVRNDLQFVADRLKIDLSWHRIRAYVGRLMGILGRAPDRATLTNLSVQDAAPPSPSPIGPAPLPPEPVGPTGPTTPATPPPQYLGRLAQDAPVTHAVERDFLEAAVAMAQLEMTGSGQGPALGATGNLVPITPPRGPAEPSTDDVPTPPPAPPIPARQFAAPPFSPLPAGPRVGNETTVPLPPPHFAPGRPLPAGIPPGGDEATRIYAGPSPAAAGVYGTGQVRALDDDATRPLPWGQEPQPTWGAPAKDARAVAPAGEEADTAAWGGGTAAPPPAERPVGDESTETETWVFEESAPSAAVAAPPVSRRRRRRRKAQSRRPRGVPPALIGALVVVIAALFLALAYALFARFRPFGALDTEPAAETIASLADRATLACPPVAGSVPPSPPGNPTGRAPAREVSEA